MKLPFQLSGLPDQASSQQPNSQPLNPVNNMPQNTTQPTNNPNAGIPPNAPLSAAPVNTALRPQTTPLARPAQPGKVIQKNQLKSANQQPQAGKALQTLQKGMTSVIDLIAPSSIEVDYKSLRIGDRFYSTIFIAGYPRYVSANWLEPIIDYDHTMDIAMFCYPTSSSDVLADLRRKIAEMEATIASDAKSGHPIDPKVEASLQDALGLQEELAKGVERFFQFSFYITISSESQAELAEAHKQLQTELASLLLIGKPASLQMEEGFKSTMPIGQDKLFITRNMDTSSLASTFPFTSAVMTQNKGVLYGMNQQNGSLIIFDRFSLENANEIVFGKSGAGKSFLIKLEIMRQFMMGTEVIVVDPEGEYGTLTKTLGGELVEFSSNSPIKINPFDLSQIYEEGENELGLKILSLHALLRLIMGQLDPAHDATLDSALIETYRQKGITPDPATQKNKPPLMEDLYKTLMGMENTVAKEEGIKTLEILAKVGLVSRYIAETKKIRAKNITPVYVMCEIPSNVLLADDFLEIFDGMSIGSNDLTQLTLGLDRDAGLLSHIGNEKDPAVKKLIEIVIKKCNEHFRYIGICGQAPSDYPDFAEFLVEKGIHSISVNPDVVVSTLITIAKKEGKSM